MINLFNLSDNLKQIQLFFVFSAFMLLFGCSTPDFSELEAEINAAALVTPAAPALPTDTTAQNPDAVAESGIELNVEPAVESELSAYPEPVAEGGYPEPVAEVADGAYPAVETENVTEPVVEAAPDTVADEADAGQTAQLVTDLNPAAVAPAADQSSAASLELEWADLIPADFSADAIYEKYQEELSKYPDGDPKAQEVYTQMQEEFNNAPTNEELNGKLVRVPGFITALDYSADTVTEFLLVPYFGACIHVPPPPVNQTVFVTTDIADGIAIEDTFAPIWVVGVLQTESTSTELATAGYTIIDAKIETYSDQQ